MRIGTDHLTGFNPSARQLHPVFGLDEDWNKSSTPRSSAIPSNCIQSSGWMRIGTYLRAIALAEDTALHPVFGLDEDWNADKRSSKPPDARYCIQSSGWMRIGTTSLRTEPLALNCIQSSGWMRIGTAMSRQGLPDYLVIASSLRAG